MPPGVAPKTEPSGSKISPPVFGRTFGGRQNLKPPTAPSGAQNLVNLFVELLDHLCSTYGTRHRIFGSKFWRRFSPHSGRSGPRRRTTRRNRPRKRPTRCVRPRGSQTPPRQSMWQGCNSKRAVLNPLDAANERKSSHYEWGNSLLSSRLSKYHPLTPYKK